MPSLPGAGGATLCLAVQRPGFSTAGILAPTTRASLPPSAAQRPRRPPPASARTCSGSARPARRRRLQLSAPWSPRTERLCAPVPDPSPAAPGPVDSLRVPLSNPAYPKMNVRRVESISAQLEEASSTGGRMRWACDPAPRWHCPSLSMIGCPFHAGGGGGGTHACCHRCMRE